MEILRTKVSITKPLPSPGLFWILRIGEGAEYPALASSWGQTRDTVRWCWWLGSEEGHLLSMEDLSLRLIEETNTTFIQPNADLQVKKGTVSC